MTNSLPKTREIAAAVVFDTSGRLLLQQRDDIPNILYPGKIGLFGGHREGEETFLRPSPRIVTPDRPSLPHLMATASAGFSISNRLGYLAMFGIVGLHDIRHLDFYRPRVKPPDANPFRDCLFLRSL